MIYDIIKPHCNLIYVDEINPSMMRDDDELKDGQLKRRHNNEMDIFVLFFSSIGISTHENSNRF